jgi:hypothetical protein
VDGKWEPPGVQAFLAESKELYKFIGEHLRNSLVQGLSSIITTISSQQLISSSQRAQGVQYAIKHPNCTKDITIYARIFVHRPSGALDVLQLHLCESDR